ncbi:hypothetical protein [Peterkaempfera bronchialis]|uniref:Uncharacterized protein n=1 Tax=Peterkaempfera bronchialis TaxID=2126346 RepID=A0A345T4W3_9ACTN|nr:hypothetical protein [Peterkaempfera bronchialis]AXI81018.1 hypothetical protein C7M71_030195 [Peterkaempfera bronchialis]
MSETAETGSAEHEFDLLMSLHGHDVPEGLRPGVLAVHLELRRMTALLRTANLPPEAEPAHVFSVETYARQA